MPCPYASSKWDAREVFCCQHSSICLDACERISAKSLIADFFAVNTMRSLIFFQCGDVFPPGAKSGFAAKSIREKLGRRSPSRSFQAIFAEGYRWAVGPSGRKAGSIFRANFLQPPPGLAQPISRPRRQQVAHRSVVIHFRSAADRRVGDEWFSYLCGTTASRTMLPAGFPRAEKPSALLADGLLDDARAGKPISAPVQHIESTEAREARVTPPVVGSVINRRYALWLHPAWHRRETLGPVASGLMVGRPIMRAPARARNDQPPKAGACPAPIRLPRVIFPTTAPIDPPMKIKLHCCNTPPVRH